MRRVLSSASDRGKKSTTADAVCPVPSDCVEDDGEAPIWAAFRHKIFFFVSARNKSPSRSPTGFKNPFASTTPSPKSCSTKCPGRRSPSSRGSSSVTPPLRSPPPAGPSTSYSSAGVRRCSYSKSARESKSSSEEATELSLNSSSRRNSAMVSSNLKSLGLSLKRDRPESIDSSASGGTPGTTSPGTPSGYRKMTMTHTAGIDLEEMGDALRLAEAAYRPRKWSYHGTATPSAAPILAPKRHSFSTASDHKSGITVSNNDLAKLLGQNKLLLPGFPLGDTTPLPIVPNHKVRGRSQSIAVCAQVTKFQIADEPIASVLIKTIDCDHVASSRTSSMNRNSIDVDDSTEETPDKLLWDSSGSTVNVNIFGSVIEKYLKTTKKDDEREESQSDEKPEEGNPSDESISPSSIDHRGSTGGVAPAFKGLRVK